MTEKAKSRLSAADAYAMVSRQDQLLYHVAHARKENTAEDYDGGKLKTLSQETVADDITRMRAAAEEFRNRSIPRP